MIAVNLSSGIAMKLLPCLTVAALALVGASACATDIRWSASDTFENTASIAPGKVLEVCGMIESRLPVEWKFSATGATEFNVHRHSGQEVIYATRSYQTRAQQGKLSPNSNYEWCWMWTNTAGEPISVTLSLKR
ncbi:MAG: hypothetical protein EAZ37_01915 [Burkholderiales bacterium]|nr:MAG: hypothetical protein EAZ43_09490 [Betaproteobacteria bacterium]TAG28304.1 MAG: hypothetical protein EAZ37_01915 [Burkholderiales bacterium]